MDIKAVIARRSDLSTFLVHLTRDEEDESANDKLQSILNDWSIEARSMFGAGRKRLVDAGITLDSQKCVCFTETPLEYVNILFEEIDNRDISFGAYGVAIPKKIARYKGVNPVWYIDITPGPGRDWLMNPVNQLINHAFAGTGFPPSHIARLAPFIEQMGTHLPAGGIGGYRKDFWWEREWRHVGPFELPDRIIVLCPEAEIAAFRAIVDGKVGKTASYIDPQWGLEQIISRLAGYTAADTDIL